MKRRLYLYWGTLFCAGFWVGCASTPPTPIHSNHWSGRLVLTIQTQPPERHSAAFELMGSAAQGELSLLNPLGTTVAQARWMPALAQLQQGERIQTFTSMPELLQVATGAALPLASVFEWLQGIPSHTPGWEVDLTQHSQGRIRAHRNLPEPTVELLIVLQRP
jgi:outer membrane lipoprotein LolB